MINDFWEGRRVLVTGHTGFKGAWLSRFLKHLGAEVYGLALPPSYEFSAYELATKNVFTSEAFLDLRDSNKITKFVRTISPSVIFHLAAQASVLNSYEDPLNTWESNVIGSLNLLQSIGPQTEPTSVIVVTTDKVYLNDNSGHEFVESDALGGSDPYSGSKVAVENLVSSHRSYFSSLNMPIKIATARAGNVIGGGDWLENRIMPDILRATDSGNTLVLRNPNSTRPWQHVLEPILGYIKLAMALVENDDKEYQSSFNFSSNPGSTLSVKQIVELASNRLRFNVELASQTEVPYEAKFLALNSNKARTKLDWNPILTTYGAVDLTIDWHLAFRQGEDMNTFMINQIRNYEEATNA